MLFVETLIFLVELLLSGDFRVRKSAARARAAGAAGGARREGRATTSVVAAGAAVVAQLVVVASVRGENTGSWMPSARVLGEHVLHLLESERMAVVNESDKLFVGLLVAGGFGEMEPHKGDKGVNFFTYMGFM